MKTKDMIFLKEKIKVDEFISLLNKLHPESELEFNFTDHDGLCVLIEREETAAEALERRRKDARRELYYAFQHSPDIIKWEELKKEFGE